MRNNRRNTTVFWSLLGIVLVIVFIGVGVAARPGIGFALVLVSVIFLASHFYLQKPIADDELIENVYPKRLAALSIVLFLFLPHLIFKLGDIGLVIQFGVPLVFLLFANYHVLRSRNFKWRVYSTNTLIIIVIFSILLSMVFGYVFRGVPFNSRDILEIKAPVYYFLFFNLFFQMDWNPNEIRKYFLSPLIIGGVFTVLLGFIQYFNPFEINQNFFAYWTEEHHLRELLKPESRRIFSTFSAAGIFGIFLVFLLAHLLIAFVSTSGSGKIKIGIFIILAMAALSLTGTKSSFVLFLMLLIIYPLFFYREWLKAYTVSVSTIVVMLAITVIIWPRISDSLIVKRMQDVSRSISNFVTYGTSIRPEEYLDETSVGRYALVVMAVPWIESSPILGHGPAKSYLVYESFHFEGAVEMRFESSYLHIITRYGIFGLIVNVLLYGNLMLIQSRTLRKKGASIELRRVAASHLSFALLLLLAFLMGDFIYNIQIMSFLFGSTGISASFLYSHQV